MNHFNKFTLEQKLQNKSNSSKITCNDESTYYEQNEQPNLTSENKIDFHVFMENLANFVRFVQVWMRINAQMLCLMYIRIHQSKDSEFSIIKKRIPGSE